MTCATCYNDWHDGGVKVVLPGVSRLQMIPQDRPIDFII